MKRKPLEPREAVKAMLSGETLTSGGMYCLWDHDKFVFYNPRFPGIPLLLNQFKGLYRKPDDTEDV